MHKFTNRAEPYQEILCVNNKIHIIGGYSRQTNDIVALIQIVILQQQELMVPS